LVWEYLTDPTKRVQHQVGTDRVDQANATGRRGVGTTNHCVHGHGTVVEEILDWRPFRYFTVRSMVPGLGLMKRVCPPWTSDCRCVPGRTVSCPRVTVTAEATSPATINAVRALRMPIGRIRRLQG
jgi:hypothetical protein